MLLWMLLESNEVVSCAVVIGLRISNASDNDMMIETVPIT